MKKKKKKKNWKSTGKRLSNREKSPTSVAHARTRGNPLRGHVTSGSPVGHAQWYYCTTTIVRKKRGENPDMRTWSLPYFQFRWFPVTSLPVVHAHAITSGSVTTSQYDFFRADILLTTNTKLDTLYNEVSKKASICSAENIWIDFKTKLESLVKQHIPFKKLSTKIKTPWITLDTKKLIKKRDKLYKTMNKSGSKQQRDNYKQIKHQVQKSLPQSYWKFIENLVTPNEDESMKKFWSYIKSKKTDYNSITSLKQESKLITDTKQKASVLNQQFQSVFSEPSTVTT